MFVGQGLHVTEPKAENEFGVHGTQPSAVEKYIPAGLMQVKYPGGEHALAGQLMHAV